MRLERGRTQVQIAHALDVEVSTISRLERGKLNTTLRMIYRLADAFECDPCDLFRHELQDQS